MNATVSDSQFEKAVEALIGEMDYAHRNVGGDSERWRIRYVASFNIVRVLFDYETACAVENEACRRAELRGITPIRIARAIKGV